MRIFTKNGCMAYSFEQMDSHQLKLQADLTPGYPSEHKEDYEDSVSMYAGMIPEELERERAEAQAEMDKVTKALESMLTVWAEAASRLTAIEAADKLLRWEKESVPNSHNKWLEQRDTTKNRFGEFNFANLEISNRVYSCTIQLLPPSYKMCWTVVYNLRSQGPEKERLLHMSKEFPAEEPAWKYFEGRKKALERKYFTEELPSIPEEFREAFLEDGFPIPGLRYQ